MNPLTLHNSPEAVSARTKAIHAATLAESHRIRAGNFTNIGTDDLARLFRLYDEQFFDGWLAQTVAATAAGPLTFRLSSTMTRAGGKTITYRPLGPDGTRPPRYEIAIGIRMLFMNFRDGQRSVTVCGLACADRLEALQRITEHEIVHLIELLTWGKSSCSAGRFKTLAANIFGHPGTRHDLVTPRERAAVEHGIKVGDAVEFTCERVRHVGTVNRIHHRATVLVESEDGQRYSDGKRYQKFYVPLGMLKRAPQ